MATLAQIDQLLNTPTPPWQDILDALLAHFNCPTGTLHKLNYSDNMLHLVAQRGIPEFLLPKVSVIPIGKGMAGICAERKAPVQTCNLQTDTTGVVRPGAKETKMEGAITVPVLLNGVLRGTLGIAKPHEYEFGTEEVANLENIANRIGAIWGN
jgi:L-methionine (R)-S-oxide reductase